jgi:hypothetical protein
MDKKNGTYQCISCKKFYKSYKSLWNHNRKFHNNDVVECGSNVAVGKNTNEVEIKKFYCKFCEKIFNHNSNRCKHQKICKYQNKIIESNVQNINNITTQNINNGTINNNNQNININLFTQDNLSFIESEFFVNLLKQTLFEDDHHKVIPEVIEKIKFNQEHHENHNILISDKRSKSVEILTKDGWKKIDENLCIEFLTKRGYQIYKDLSDIHKDKIKGRYIESNENFNESFLNGNIMEETTEKMKEVLVKGTKKIMSQSRKELEEELSKELII